MWRKFDVFMAEADAGEGGGAAGGWAYAGTGADYGGQGQTVAIPERYQVKTEGGALDIEASSLKLAEAYRTLEKRVGTGDMRPSSAAEYKIAVPEELKGDWDQNSDPLLSSFLKDAHEAGYTQSQIDFVMGKYFEIAPQLMGGPRQFSAETCVAELKQEWQSDEQYSAETRKAFKAAQAYGDKDAEAIIQNHGNDPRIIRLLARIGAQMGEDRSINPGGTQHGIQTVEGLMRSEAYSNPKHPDHQRVSAQVQAYYAKQAGDR